MSFHPKVYKQKFRGRKGTEYIVVCPFCSGDLHWNAGLQGGQCFRCGSKFNTTKMNFHFRGNSNSAVDDLIEKIVRPREAPKQKAIPLYGYQKHWQARWHLEEYRRCDPATLDKLGVWYDEEEDRVCIPIQPVLPGGGNVERPYMSRHTDPDVKGWKAQPPGIEKEQYWFTAGRIPNRRAIILVEGIFDVLTPRLEGIAIATLGTKLSPAMQDWFWLNSPDVYLWYDPDEAGERASDTISRQLLGIVPVKGVIRGVPEPGDLSPKQAREILKECGLF